MDGMLALDAATYEADHAVKFVVLDDAILAARRRGGRYRERKACRGEVLDAGKDAGVGL